MKRIGILFGVAIFTVSLAGCSSPYLPHNAIKDIPEFYNHREIQTDKTTKEVIILNEKTFWGHEPYFSSDSIRERYSQHIQNETADSDDLLFDIARDTVELMRRDGKSDDEIRIKLKDTFHFSDEVIDELVK